MVYAIGDSHAACSFRNIPEIKVSHIGAITLKRVGVLEDDFISNVIKSMNPNPCDFLIFIFGEIDIRCYVKINLEHRSNLTLDSLLGNWVSNYCQHISLMPTNGAKIVIMSITPPAPYSSAQSIEWPVSGTDEERALYTKEINKLLKQECQNRDWVYLDVYSEYADEKGMLPLENIYISVHINDTTKIKKLLINYQLL
jgi:hypothetical protein